MNVGEGIFLCEKNFSMCEEFSYVKEDFFM